MSGQPGDNCNDPRKIHPHWCGFCGAELLFSQAECTGLIIVPPCLRCGEADWRDEIDAMTLVGGVINGD